jgi:hypothetical protein
MTVTVDTHVVSAVPHRTLRGTPGQMRFLGSATVSRHHTVSPMSPRTIVPMPPMHFSSSLESRDNRRPTPIANE